MNVRLLLSSLLLGCWIVLTGCVSPTRVDYDRTVVEKLATYECFTIDSREARIDYQDVVLSPIVDRRIERNLAATLKAKGFTQDCETPDFRITFNTITKTKTEINDLGIGATPFRRYPYYGYARYSNIDINEYEQGTFIVDVIDGESKELVWRGTYVKRLGWSAPDEAEIKEIIVEILEDFPPVLATDSD